MHGTIHTGASWIWSARYWAASSIRVNRSGLVPGALVVGPHRLLDHGVPDDEEPPALHVAARRRTDARLQNFSDQLGRHGVWLQAPHRSGRRHDLEQVWGFLRHDILERQNCSSSYTRLPDGHVWPCAWQRDTGAHRGWSSPSRLGSNSETVGWIGIDRCNTV